MHYRGDEDAERLHPDPGQVNSTEGRVADLAGSGGQRLVLRYLMQARRGHRSSSARTVAPGLTLAHGSHPRPLEGLRVCVVYDCLFPWTIGGAERWYRALAERFAEAGAQVTYLTCRQWDEEPRIEGVRVVAVAPRQELYEGDGTRRIAPPLRFGAGVLGWLVRHRSDIDAVHVANFPYFSLLAARLALVGTGTPVRVDWFEVWPKAFWCEYAGAMAGQVGYRIQELCIALSSHSFVFWDHTAVRLRARRFARRVTVLPGLLPVSRDTKELSPPAEASASVVSSGPPIVLYAGRHIKDKGIRDLPPALAAARHEFADLRLVLAGEGPETPLVQQRVHELGLEHAVEFPGKVTEAELATLMQRASCAVVASVREGYGMIVVEASSNGTPSVVANHPENAASGHVVESVNGFVVEPTPEGLADGIIRVLHAGAPLRTTTRAWYDLHAPSMSMAASTDKVIALYAAEHSRTGSS